MTDQKKAKKSKKLIAKTTFLHPILKRTIKVGAELTKDELKGCPDEFLR